MSLPKRMDAMIGQGICLAVLMLFVSAPASAAGNDAIRLAQADTTSKIELRDDHPDRYVVVKGDTLWDISAKFLKSPWLWPEIWYVNPQVENPHLIYPGDILTLIWVNGRPQLRLERGSVEKLSPKIRASALDAAITTIPYDAIAGFLSRPGVISREERDSAPYIFSSREGHLIGAAGMDVYVRASKAPVGALVSVMNVGKELVDPDDGDVLGYQAHYVGSGRVDATGDPSTVRLVSTEREALKGDLLFSEPPQLPLHFTPRAPAFQVNGQVIAIAADTAMAGQFMVVAVNRGQRHGLEPGHVLSAFRAGQVVRDRVRGGFMDEKVKLPDEFNGQLMIFKTLDRMSYGLILDTHGEIRKGDIIRNP